MPSRSAQQPNHSAAPKSTGSFHQVSFYTRFFDINTEDFIGKIVLALNPFNHASVASTQTDDGPTELYGFLWINATLVFLMFVSATGSNLLAQWLHGTDDAPKYEYNFQLLTLSITIFYGYTVIVPALLYVVTTWFMHFSPRLSLTRLVSIYSYANVLWIPTTAANVVLAVFVSKAKHHFVLNILQWVLVAVSASLSGLSIVLKVRPIILQNVVSEPGTEDANAPKRNNHQALLLAIVVAHLAFAVVIKFSFFGIA
ncbi:hypothetical protein JCM33374_g2662 [Metschnikowia sp. JCM 33374]|nr:hypothetical protein JCM33374_g2662 [Metschnikowia sp. JCM 33374]